MMSPRHRGNLLERRLDRVGIGLAEVAGPRENKAKLVPQRYAAAETPLVRMSAAREASAE